MTNLPALRIDERSVRRLKLGYPWVFRSEVISGKDAVALTPGQMVNFVRDKGDFVARGFFNPKPQLVGRVLSWKPDQAVGKDFVFHQIENALRLREKLYSQPFYRLVHAESDGLPGLIIDRYGDVVACQVNTAGMESLWPHIEAALKTLVKPQAIVLKNDTAAREMEGLEQSVRVASGSMPAGGVTIVENETQFHVDVVEGQKTGWFFDQRENRAWVADLAKGGTMLDVFCHTGGFGITAAQTGAANVTFVDSSAPALEMVKKNAALNGVEKKCQMIEGKAFDVMEKLAKTGKKYNVVVVDPPAFIKSRKDMAVGLKGYMKLAKLAEPLVAKNGFLYFASCSSHAGVNELSDAVTEGMSKSGRAFQLVKTSGAAPDHPVHPLLPETSYLKGLTFRFLD
ncbi:MAG: class I SAM-dependent rRNA methyltransferase [Alphaproteobacteria bacterium]|nr:class I SAM-dependent rRNA methyltransferase [Alphaproteobacteria bacterium]